MFKRVLLKIVVLFAAWAVSFLVYHRVDMLHRGGPIMIAILMCSVFALTIAFERAYFFAHIKINSKDVFERLKKAVTNQRWDDAEVLNQQLRGPLARVVAAGLMARQRSAETIDRVMEEAAHDQLPHLHKYHNWLATIAQVATLLGLLGTVVGMVVAFQTIQQQTAAMQPVSPSDLAGGIWQALITTVAGLEVAIPTIVVYHYFRSRIEEIKHQIEKASSIISHWRG